MTSKDKQDVISVCNILADKMSDSGKVAVQQIIDAVKDMVENEPCEDCISRKDVIILIDEATELHPYKVIGDSETYSDYNQGWEDACNWLYANIESDNLKTVTPQPKTGHWICHREHCENLGVIPSGLGAYEWRSNCDCGIDVTEFHMNHYNYCPNCGARMEVEDEDKT